MQKWVWPVCRLKTLLLELPLCRASIFEGRYPEQNFQEVGCLLTGNELNVVQYGYIHVLCHRSSDGRIIAITNRLKKSTGACAQLKVAGHQMAAMAICLWAFVFIIKRTDYFCKCNSIRLMFSNVRKVHKIWKISRYEQKWYCWSLMGGALAPIPEKECNMP